MSYPGYPYQGSNNPPYTQQPPSGGAPYPSGPHGVFPPSVGYNYGSPMYMPQPYTGMGGHSPSGVPSAYPPSGGSSAYPPAGGSPAYPPAGGSPAYLPSGGSSAYPPAGGSPAYPPAGRSPSYPPASNSPAYPPSQHHSSSQQYSHHHSSQHYSHGHNQAPTTPSYTQSPVYPSTGYSTSNYPSSQGQYTIKRSPTVVPAHPFNPREDAEVLRKAMKGFGTDEKAIIKVLSRRSNAQRLEIAVQFKTLFGKDLIKDLKSELTGNFENLVVALMTPLPQFYAVELHDAISGVGTDEDVLIETMCTLTNSEIRTIREAYQRTFYRNLESDLRGDTGGHFKRLMVSLCTAGRDESMMTNPQAAQADAQALLRAGELRVGTDESTFNMILCQRNHAQLQLVFSEYQRLTGHDIEKAVKHEFSGDIEEGLLAVIRSIKNQALFFAKRLNKSMKGMGTNDRDLIRLVTTRSEIDMGDIKREYGAKYGESLADAIKSDCSGDYKKCLLALIGEA